MGRNALRGPGINNWDLSIMKKIRIAENQSLEFRAEFFNAWNHTQFSAVSSGSGTTFGQVAGARSPRLVQLALKYYF
jgi:hypothetical protein